MRSSSRWALPDDWKPEDFATAKKMVTQYKQIREIVQRGSLYRLISPQKGSEQSVTASVSEDQRHAVAFVFLHSSQMLYPFPRIAALDGKLSAGSPAIASGAFWMQYGLDVDLRGDFQAAAFTLEMVEQ